MKTTVQRRPHQLPIVWPMMMLGLLITFNSPNEYLNPHIVTRAKPKTSQRASPSSSCGRARRWAPPRRQTPPPPIQAQAQRVRAGKNLIVRTRCTAIWHRQVGRTPPKWRSSQIMWVKHNVQFAMLTPMGQYMTTFEHFWTACPVWDLSMSTVYNICHKEHDDNYGFTHFNN